MNLNDRARYVSLLLLAGFFVAAPAMAQEEAPVEVSGSRIGNFFIEYESWIAQPTGLEYVPATEGDPGSFGSASTIEIDHGTSDEPRYSLEWVLPSELGTLRSTVYKHVDSADESRYDPSHFIFGQTLSHPLFAGVNNDGLADAFSAVSETKLRDFSIEFARQAFSSPRLRAEWFVGWRRVEHDRYQAASYLALVPDFPPLLLPPVDTCFQSVEPCPETAVVSSSYEGRGATVGVDLEFPLWKNRVVLEGSLAVGVLRGDTETSYNSENYLYLLDLGSEGVFVLGPPYSEFDDSLIIDGDPPQTIPLIDLIEQVAMPVGVSSNLSSSSQIFEASLGFRWRTPYKRLEVFGGIRQSHYDNVGTDLRPKVSTVTLTELGEVVYNIQDIERVDRSVTYEGFFVGARFRLY